MSDDNLKIFGCFGLLALIPIMIIVSAAVDAYVVMKLWGWFAVTVFGFAPLGIAQAAGVSLLIGYLTQPTKNDGKGDKDIFEALFTWIGTVFLRAFFVLLIGWIIFQFIPA